MNYFLHVGHDVRTSCPYKYSWAVPHFSPAFDIMLGGGGGGGGGEGESVVRKR